MKLLLNIILLSAMSLSMFAQDVNSQTGFAGDHFSLEGAIDVFKNSNTLEEFEEKLNRESSNVINLDLNEDGHIDYIRVIDNQDGEVHAIVLQAVLGSNEFQDVAVIEVEKDGASSATLQIVGDEDVFGSQIYVEPFEEVQSGQDNKGPRGDDYVKMRLVVNVWFYPSVRYIYGPTYRVWSSPYRWGNYPRYWKPRRPFAWNVFYPRTRVWNNHYHAVKRHRLVKAHRVYTPRRRSSVSVKRRTTVVRTNNKTRVTTRKNTNVVRNGKTTKVRKKTTKTTVKKKGNGKVKMKKKVTRKTVKKTNN